MTIALQLVAHALLLTASGQDAEFGRDTARHVAHRLARELRERYVFEDVGERCALGVLELAETEAVDVRTPEALQSALQAKLGEITGDAHLRVSVRGAVRPPKEPTETWRTPGRLYNYGFARVERLPGNVGYLEMTGFHDPERAAPTATSAMTFLRECDAIVLDLRRNGGGSAEMVKLVASWLLPPKTPLSGIYWRESGETEQAWTEAWLEERMRPDVPVFCLTSGYTFSAAEALVYDLRVAGRAQTVGARTGGGAHPGEGIDLGDGFHVWMPMGRAVHPSTGSNWEGVGVTPDHAVEPGLAPRRAHALALEATLAGVEDARRRAELEWLIEWARALAEPPASADAAQASWAGRYGDRSVAIVGGHLHYVSPEHSVHRLAPLNGHDDLYAVADRPDFRVHFSKGGGGTVAALVLTRRNGNKQRLERLP